MRGNATVFRLRRIPGGVNPHGDQVDSTVERFELLGCAVAPVVGGRFDPEIQERGRTGVVVRQTLFAPLGTDLRYTDELEVDGVVWQVDGVPGPWRSPFSGWLAGLEVMMRRSQG